MILDHSTINFHGKMLFEKATIKPPFSVANPMPNEACFLYIREGTALNFSEADIFQVKEGQSVLMKCGSYLSRMLANQNTGHYSALAVHFYPEVLKKVYEDGLPEAVTANKRITDENMVQIDASILVDKYIESVLFYFDHQQLITEEILTLKLKELILLLLQTPNADRIIEILGNLFTPRTYSFKSIIETHLYADLSLEELATLTSQSLSSFKRTFSEVYNDTPARYIKHKKLEKAAELLTITDSSIADITFQCGFKEVAHFSKSFKDKYQLSPSQYRLNPIDK